jgi:hypothetical protein
VSTHERCDYRNGGFTASLDTADLDSARGPWRFEVELAVPALTRVGRLARISSVGSATLSHVGRSAHGADLEAGPLDGSAFGLRRLRADPSIPRVRSRTV